MATSGSWIYLGPWINWSQGHILGSTITLSTTSGSILTALIATFLTFITTQIWRIVAFTWHQCISGQELTDGLRHQQRVILRNSITPASTAWEFFQQTYYWRSHINRGPFENLAWISIALFFTISAPLLSVFGASGIVNPASNERIIVGSHCGYWGLVDSSHEETLQRQDFEQKWARDIRQAQNHAELCYDEGGESTGCNKYSQKMLTWTERINVTCPFEPSLCWTLRSMPYQMDTGLLDSHIDLGINAPSRDRIKIRKLATCSLLNHTGYAQMRDGPDEDTTSIIEWFFGPTSSGNATFTYNTRNYYANLAYSVDVLQTSPTSQDEWKPIAQLNRTDADMDIILVASNAVMNYYEVDDPLFSAHLPTNQTYGNETYYDPDYWARCVACATQFQICNPGTGSCSELGSHDQILSEAMSIELGLSENQQASVRLISYTTLLTGLAGVIGGRSGAALKASETLTQTRQGYLPPNQYQIELSGFFNTGLVRIQQRLQEYATGVRQYYSTWKNHPPNKNSADERLCTSQKTNEPNGTISFSVLGLSVIFIAGSFITMISLVLEWVTSLIQKHFIKTADARRVWWVLDDKLQLQRMLFERLGMGVWSRKSSSVPVSSTSLFGGLLGKRTDDPRIGLSSSWESKDIVSEIEAQCSTTTYNTSDN